MTVSWIPGANKWFRPDLKQRFFAKVYKDGSNCWHWIGATAGDYGRFNGVSAHEVSWWLAGNASVPKGQVLMHSCDNGLCVNPKHLSVGSQAKNLRDAARKGTLVGRLKQTHCVHGHKLEGKNVSTRTIRNGRQRRDCMACVELRKKRMRHEYRAARKSRDTTNARISK